LFIHIVNYILMKEFNKFQGKAIVQSMVAHLGICLYFI
jgi:hypothetical protein